LPAAGNPAIDEQWRTGLDAAAILKIAPECFDAGRINWTADSVGAAQQK
jgi:hypothetical protein